MNDRDRRWIQRVDATLYLNGGRWSDCDEKELHTCGVHASTVFGAVGSLAEGRRAEVDWPGPGQAVLVHIQSPEAVSGGIRPAERARSRLALTLAEREEISRGIAVGVSLRSIAGSLGRSPSTVSREIERNGGPARYRAAGADKRAWAVARRPKACKLARHPRLSPGGCGEAGAELVAGGDRQGRSPAGSSGDIRIIRPGTCRMRRSIAACSFRPVGC